MESEQIRCCDKTKKVLVVEKITNILIVEVKMSFVSAIYFVTEYI